MRTPAGAKFPLPLLYDVASQYYGENATQDEIAARMKVSRPSVSRLLAEARRVGIVEITVHPPESGTDRVLSGRVAAALGLREVYVVRAGSGPDRGRWLAAGLSLALTDAALTLGDVLLVSSGMTLYQCAQQDLPQIAGVVVIPTVGGQEEPEPWYQTNVLASMFAERMDGRPTYLYAPALPTATLHRSLLREPSFIRMQELWESAKVAVVGVGAPVGARAAVPNFVRHEAAGLKRAVGDICSRFYDRNGRPVAYPGSDRLVAISLETLRRIPVTIAVAAGVEKTLALTAAARCGYFNTLVTDTTTATALLKAAA